MPIELARTYEGQSLPEVMLKADARVFAGVGGAALIEERAGRVQWHGFSSGFSIPVGSLGGRRACPQVVP